MNADLCSSVNCLGSRPFRLISLLALSFAAALAAGCGGSGQNAVGTGSASGNTTVVLLASSTANDQLSSFSVTVSSLTLTTKSGSTVNVLASPVTEEFMHLNGHVEPVATVSIPRGDYVSASATYSSSSPVCNGQAPGLLMNDSLTGGPDSSIVLSQPISVTGTAMGLVLNLQVSIYPEACPTATQYVFAPPVSAAFHLTPLTIAAQPTSSADGLATGLEGTISSVGAGGTTIGVNALAEGQTAPVWQVNVSSNTRFQGVSSASQLAAGVPVDMDVALQPDGTLQAARIATLSASAPNLTVVSGQLLTVSNTAPVTFVEGAAQLGYLPTAVGGFGYVNFGSARLQTSSQFGNLGSLPFVPSFSSANLVPGQNVTATTQATAVTGGPDYIPLTTMTLRPQTINGKVSAISSVGNFTAYTITLASYDLFSQLAVQPGQTTLLTNPNTIVVYADSNTQKLNSGAIAVGGLFRFYGLVFNDNGTLRMDCSEVTDGAAE